MWVESENYNYARGPCGKALTKTPKKSYTYIFFRIFKNKEEDEHTRKKTQLAPRVRALGRASHGRFGGFRSLWYIAPEIAKFARLRVSCGPCAHSSV